jgi:hypothetical protein
MIPTIPMQNCSNANPSPSTPVAQDWQKGASAQPQWPLVHAMLPIWRILDRTFPG